VDFYLRTHHATMISPQADAEEQLVTDFGVDTSMEALITAHNRLKEARNRREQIRKSSGLIEADLEIKDMRAEFKRREAEIAAFLQERNHTECVYKGPHASYCLRLAKQKVSQSLKRGELLTDLRVICGDETTASDIHGRICNELHPIPQVMCLSIRLQK
jgi:hypothetical protein